LFQAAGDAKAAGAGFVADFQAGTGMGLADSGQDLLQSVQVVGDGSVAMVIESLWTSSPI